LVALLERIFLQLSNSSMQLEETRSFLVDIVRELGV
jgi:hypothetical protein